MRIAFPVIFALFALASPLAWGQELRGLDSNSIPLPIADSNFGAIRRAALTPRGQFDWKLRSSYLRRPIALHFPSASSDGTTARAIDGAVLLELAAHVGLPVGFDAGMRMGGQLGQWGPGVRGNSTPNAPIAPTGGTDPELELAWGARFNAVSLRPYATVQFPLGSEDALAGEAKTRLGLGVVLGNQGPLIEWSGMLGVTYRPLQEIAGPSWSSQFVVAGGALLRLSPHWQLGPELRLAPLLGAGVKRSFLMPAESLITARHRRTQWNLGLVLGVGLPLSTVPNGPEHSELVRAPTTPNYRFIVEYGMNL